jgi:hypothetical protein
MHRAHAGADGLYATSCRLGAVSLAVAVLAVTGAARADIFHLRTGGTIDGQSLGVEQEQYQIRTTVGLVRVPVSAVERVEPGPTPFDEYDQRVKDLRETPEGNTELGVWCEEQGLRVEARKHLSRAIELDPDYAPARRALGYVRVGGFWIEGRSTVERKESPATSKRAAPEDRQRLARAIQGQWARRIKAIRDSLLESPLEQNVTEGRGRILEIKDPLAILPLSQVLSGGSAACRALLIEALGQFREDEATMNLAVLALVDRSDEIRSRAVAELVRRNDPRVVAQFKEALRSASDVILRRAAYGLGQLKAREVIPNLVDVLTAERNKWIEVPVIRYFDDLRRTFDRPTTVFVGDRYEVLHIPEIGVWSPFSDIENEWRLARVTVFRTEVLEALKQITGVNFGFETADWRRWYEEQRP